MFFIKSIDDFFISPSLSWKSIDQFVFFQYLSLQKPPVLEIVCCFSYKNPHPA